MYKKIFSLTILLFSLVIFCGCDNNDAKNINEKTDENMNGEKTVTNESSTNDIDVDLTTLSSTMVYSEVYNMLTNPNKYIGKIVKMNGIFVKYTNQSNTMIYPAIVIADATACCQQGMEFVLKGEPEYPNGYPNEDEEATVVGKFETYDENGYMYCHLVDAEIIK